MPKKAQKEVKEAKDMTAIDEISNEMLETKFAELEEFKANMEKEKADMMAKIEEAKKEAILFKEEKEKALADLQAKDSILKEMAEQKAQSQKLQIEDVVKSFSFISEESGKSLCDFMFDNRNMEGIGNIITVLEEADKAIEASLGQSEGVPGASLEEDVTSFESQYMSGLDEKILARANSKRNNK